MIWPCGDTKKHAPVDPTSPHHQIKSVIKVLLSQGYETSVCEHGHQVSESHKIAAKVIKQPPDLLLICLQSAGNEGYALCQKLRQSRATRHLPIIFLGSRLAPSQRLQVLRCGGTAYLQLPMSSEECWLSLKQHIDTARLVRQLQSDSMSMSHKVDKCSQVLDRQKRLELALAQENQALQKLVFVDGLTQVANRRSFNQTIAKRWQEAYENQQPLSLLLCDIDYFKRYNDTYGHVVGDRCLRIVADALVRGTHRDQDQVARYGGEEFAIILSETETSGAQRIALSVQSEIARAQISHEGSLIKRHISLSIGVFTLVPHSAHQPCEMLIHGADEALYAAKLGGRDRTVTKTVSGFSSSSENYCLYDYTQDYGPFSKGTAARPAVSRAAADSSPQILKQLSTTPAARTLNPVEPVRAALLLPSLATFLATSAEPLSSAELTPTVPSTVVNPNCG